MTDEEALAAAIEAGWKEYEAQFQDWWSRRSDFQEGRPEFAAAVRAVWDLAVAHGQERAVEAIESAGHASMDLDDHVEASRAFFYARIARGGTQ